MLSQRFLQCYVGWELVRGEAWVHCKERDLLIEIQIDCQEECPPHYIMTRLQRQERDRGKAWIH